MIYEFADGSVAYFAPDAPDFAEARELKGDDLAAAQRVLDERDLLVETQCDFQPLTLPGTCGVSIPANERGIPLANIQALYGDSTERVFLRISPKTPVSPPSRAGHTSL